MAILIDAILKLIEDLAILGQVLTKVEGEETEGGEKLAAPEFTISTKEEYLLVEFEIPGGNTSPGEFVSAVEALEDLLSGSRGVVLSGRGPVWGYGMLIHSAHATPWIACADPRLGAVVVASHSSERKVGEIITL